MPTMAHTTIVRWYGRFRERIAQEVNWKLGDVDGSIIEIDESLFGRNASIIKEGHLQRHGCLAWWNVEQINVYLKWLQGALEMICFRLLGQTSFLAIPFIMMTGQFTETYINMDLSMGQLYIK